MSDPDTLQRLEALLISLRDQVDALADRVDGRLHEHHRMLRRLEADLGELAWELRAASLDAGLPTPPRAPAA